jgi:hypothetical protein
VTSVVVVTSLVGGAVSTGSLAPAAGSVVDVGVVERVGVVVAGGSESDGSVAMVVVGVSVVEGVGGSSGPGATVVVVVGAVTGGGSVGASCACATVAKLASTAATKAAVSSRLKEEVLRGIGQTSR